MLNVFIFNKTAKNVVGIIAAQHGNEKAPSIIIQNLLLSNYFLKKSKELDICIKVIPIANEWGYRNNSRYYLFKDINRSYDGKNKLNNNILNFLGNCDIILDFHEGWGYYNEKKGSLGSTISANTNIFNKIVNNISNTLNEEILNLKHKFAINVLDISKYENSLIHYCTKHNINCIVIEISGQGNVAPLEKRMYQTYTFLNLFLYNFYNHCHN